ncbi:MAG: glycosyltransferase family 4 protein [Candidatus Omnitrophica bacterium]|nr:glycosyltransferase family 4 protein [Candidatus Omnitrophota bacterium]
MKTVLIAFYKAFPPTFGTATLTYNIAKYIVGEKYLLHLSEGKQSGPAITESGVNLINIRCFTDNHFLKMINLFLLLALIVKKIVRLNPDFIIIEGGSWSFYSLILLCMIKSKRIKADIIYHPHNVEYLLRKEKDNIAISWVTYWAESGLLRKSDMIFAVSQADAVNFARIYGIKPKVLQSGVDVEIFSKVNDVQVEGLREKYKLYGKLLLFMGIPSFKPNKEAINFLLNRIFTVITKEFPDVRLLIIGGKIGRKEPWLINPGNIPFDEVPALIKACDVCLAPIFKGAGVKFKILEYMAAAKPVISTSKGTEGIVMVKDGENIIIANDENAFLEKIVYLLKNPEAAKEIGERARILIESNYSWQRIMEYFNQALEGAQSNRLSHEQ